MALDRRTFVQALPLLCLPLSEAVAPVVQVPAYVTYWHPSVIVSRIYNFGPHPPIPSHIILELLEADESGESVYASGCKSISSLPT